MGPTKGPALSCSEESVSHLREFLFAALSLTLLISLIYSNSLDCSWHFDDASNIVANPNIHLSDFSWESVKRALYSDYSGSGKFYRPISCFTFALNYYVGGLQVTGYHLINCGIHIFAAIFLFLFIHEAFHLPKLEARYGSKSYFLALLATILWAIHPIQTQAVTYLVQRMASLAGMFYIMSMYFYLKARVAAHRWIRILFIIMSLVAFILAVGAKENALLLPLSLLFLEILLIQKSPGSWFHTGRGKALLGLIIGSVICVAFLYSRTNHFLSFFEAYEDRPFSLLERLLTEARVVVFYISLLLYPISGRFSIAHSFQVSTSLFSPLTTLLSFLFILALLLVLFWAAKKHPVISFSILFFFLNHLVESTVLPLEIVFEHRNYIPSMFFFLPWAIGLCRLLDVFSGYRHMAILLTIFTVIVVIAMGHATYLRNFIWKNDWTLWTDAAQKAPDQYRVHHNLGLYYRERGYWREAMREFQKALVCKEFHVKGETLPTHFQLARLFDDLGDLEKAKFHYENVLGINPFYPQALGNLASIYDREGQQAKADEYLLRAMKADPHNPYTNFNMGLYCLRTGKPREAFDYFNKAKKEKDLRQASARYLGIALKQMGRLGPASIYLNESVNLNADDTIARLHLLEIYLRSGDSARSKEVSAEIISSIVKSQRLLMKTLAVLSDKEESAEAGLDKATLLPPLLQACDSESERLGEIKNLLKTIAK